MNQKAKDIERYLAVIDRAVSLIRSRLKDEDGGLMETMLNEASPPAMLPPLIARPPEETSVIQVPDEEWLKKREQHIKQLMAIDCWPEAISPNLVREPTESEQRNRAQQLLNNMLKSQNVEGMHFLDFGCGEGWIVAEAANYGFASTTGYDIAISSQWTKIKDAKCTNNLQELPKQFYDIIFLYDVLDHCFDPLQLMSQVQSLLKPTGIVHVRCHPWTARHATHLFRQGVNRAYLHLFLTWDEIKVLLGGTKDPIFTRVELDPITAYHYWFSNFEIQKEFIIREDVSEFFFVPAFKELLASEQRISLYEVDELLTKMRIQFIDYRLSLKNE